MRRQPSTPTVAGAAIALLLAAPSRVVKAEEPFDARAGAEALFEEGLRLYDAARYPEACAKFTASQRLEPSAGTQLNLARCLEAQGKSASAWLAYGEAALVARKVSDERRERYARQKELELKERAPKLTIVVPDGSARATLAVRRGGAPVAPDLWGLPVAVDPGTYELEASSGASPAWIGRVTLRDGDRKTIVVEPQPPRDDGAPRRAAGAVQRGVALAVGGAGLAVLGLGGYFGVRALHARDDAAPHCGADGGCDALGIRATERARSLADASTGFFLGGGALVGAAALLFVLAPRERGGRAVTTAWSILPCVDARGAGIGVRWRR